MESIIDLFYGLICIILIETLVMVVILQIPLGSPLYITITIITVIITIISLILINKKIKKNQKKQLVEKVTKELKAKEIKKKNMTQTNIEISANLQMLYDKLVDELYKISDLINSKRIKLAQEKLFNCRRIALKYKFEKLFPLIEDMKRKLNKLNETRINNEKAILKRKILEMGTTNDRFYIHDLLDAVNTCDELLAIKVVKEMIANREIYGEYFDTSKSIVMNIQTNIKEIDQLMNIYKDWEQGNIGKKND